MNNVMKPDIRHISEKQLVDFLESIGEKRFRKKQINEWLWKKNVLTFEEMGNLSLKLIEKLKEQFTFLKTEIESELISSDGTAKFIFRLHDGRAIEGVLIPTQSRVTACISSQVGCPLKCAFCATGTMGFIRNLHFSEILDQYALMNRRALDLYEIPISNIVFMGMGEPLLNYDNVMQSIAMLTSQDGNQLSPSRITLSTVGVVDGIMRMADEGFKPGLAVSVHIPDNLLRSEIMPINRKFPLPELQSALQYFHQKTGQRITIEYVLLKDINDSTKSAERLCAFCRPFPVKINLIEFNETKSRFSKSPRENMIRFKEYLESKNLIVNVRQSRGKDIAAACGQLVKNRKVVK